MSGNILASVAGTIAEVSKGEKGATERPRNWEDIPDGSAIEAGVDEEKWIDIVLYGDNWYQCISSFSKGNGVVPSNTIYFKNITDYKRLATSLFLASKAYIHNLGVDNILITDQGGGQGNVLLKADKDGITCNQGNFKNIIVYGEVYATSGNIGGFTVKNNQFHSAADGYEFDIYNNRIVYTDLRNYRTLSISSENNGLELSLSSATDNMECKMTVDSNDIIGNTIGMKQSSTKGKSFYGVNRFYVADSAGSNVFDVSIYSSNGLVRIPRPSAGIKCYINRADKTVRLIASGLPTQKPTTGTLGTIYVEDGYLKIWEGN